MRTYILLLSVSMAALLSAKGSVPEGFRGFFYPTKSQQKLEDRLQEVEEARRNYEAGDVSRYLAKPVEKEVQCYVEYQVTHRQPGRCIKLGDRTPACQTSDYISINFSECR